MKKIILISSIILILAITLFIAAPKIKTSYVKYQLEKSNYCDTKEDCVNIGGMCPFGCYNYVNKEKEKKMIKLLNSYKSNCVYDCMYCDDVMCEDHKCVEVCFR